MHYRATISHPGFAEEQHIYNSLADELASRGVNNTEVKWAIPGGFELRVWMESFYHEFRIVNGLIKFCEYATIMLHDPDSLDTLADAIKHCLSATPSVCQACPLKGEA